MTKRGLGRDEDHRVAWEESYPHPLISCMMPGIAVLAVIAAILLGFHLWQRTLPPDTTVPMLVGVKQEDALDELKRAGLNAEVLNESQASEEIPASYVISTTPAGGRHVKAGGLVRLVISSGSAFTTVPDVRELPQTVARERVQAAGLAVAREEYAFHPTIPFDRIISIAPKQGTRIGKMSTIKLVISKGPEETQSTVGANGVPLMKSTTITVTLPTDGELHATVRIYVTDKDGERAVYQKDHRAGDTIVQTVEGNGDDISAKVYYGNRLILTRTF